MLDEATIKSLKSGLRGELIVPRDASYEEARRVWNGMIDKHPALIVRCDDVTGVINAVDFARTHNLVVAVRGGGHNVAGFGTCDGGIVIDLSHMKKIEVDAANKTARADAGLTWGEFDTATQRHGLATTGGLVSDTGIAGFTLGGGFGWLVRKCGMTVDNLLSVDMILADGTLMTASPAVNSDLFWGVCGGGGNFGIVTSFKFRLHQIGPEVYGGAILYPIDRARDLLRFYRDWAPSLPEDITTMIAFMIAPPEPFIPKEMIGTPVIGVALCHLGKREQAEKTIRPLRDFTKPAVDAVGPIEYATIQRMFDSSAPRGINAYWKTAYIGDLGNDVIATLIDHAAELKNLSPYTAVHIHHWEGAVKRANSEATSFAHRDARYVMNVVGMWKSGEDPDKHILWTRRFIKAMQPHSTGQVYINFMGDEGLEKVKAAYGTKKYERLVGLKNKYDPKNFFHLNQNIRPSV